MELIKFYNKKVRIVDSRGVVFVGVVNDYIYPEDNETNEESIIIDVPDNEYPIEFYSKDIATIKII